MNNTDIETIGEHRKKDIDKYVKFLIIDYELSFKYHIRDVINKTAKGSYALAILRHTLPKNN